MQKSQAIILDGKREAEKIIKTLKKEIINAKPLPNPPLINGRGPKDKTSPNVGLAVVLVGNDKASQTYVAIKEKRASELGVNFKKFLLPATTSEAKILALIKKLNADKKVTGILVQLPLPKKFNTEIIIRAINPSKDVDGFVPPLLSKERAGVRFGFRAIDTKKIISPTIQAIIHLIKMSKVKLAGKKAVILCNSQEFAEPLKKELEKQKIKVDVSLRPSRNSRPSGGQALFIIHYSVIIVALGKKHFLKPQMIKKNTVIVDVGINRVGKKIYGDVHPDCFKKSKFISPVPGGVGPLTVAYLFKNLFSLFKIHNS